MDNNEKFNSISDLYKRVLPALNTKVSELKREQITYINSLDIWNYCINNIWNNKNDLRIYEMVNDILNVDILKLEIYLKNNITDKDDKNER